MAGIMGAFAHDLDNAASCQSARGQILRAKKARGESARNVGLSAIATGMKKQIRARVWRAGTRTTALSAERMAGISDHALSGQKTCRGGRLCSPGRKRCG